MSPAAISTLVAEGHRLYENIERQKKLLKEIEEKLKEAGLEGEQVDLVDEELEGKQFLAVAQPSTVNPRKVTVPVVFTSDLLAKSFADQSAKHQEVYTAAKGQLTAFFHKKVVWECLYDDGKALRKVAAEHLGKDAGAFITALVQRDRNGIPKNQIKVDWSRAQVEAATPEAAL